MTQRRINGYIWRQEIARAQSANRSARSYCRRILDEQPGPALAAFLMAQIGLALAEIGEALAALKEIAAERRLGDG